MKRLNRNSLDHSMTAAVGPGRGSQRNWWRSVTSVSRLLSASALPCALLLITACGGDHDTGPRLVPSATGVWAGDAITQFGALRPITLTLQEAGQVLSGSCDIADASGVVYWTGTVAGSHVHPALSLTCSNPDPNSGGVARIDGTFLNANKIDAKLNGGAGWNLDTPITFLRQ